MLILNRKTQYIQLSQALRESLHGPLQRSFTDLSMVVKRVIHKSFQRPCKSHLKVFSWILGEVVELCRTCVFIGSSLCCSVTRRIRVWNWCFGVVSLKFHLRQPNNSTMIYSCRATDETQGYARVEVCCWKMKIFLYLSRSDVFRPKNDGVT